MQHSFENGLNVLFCPREDERLVCSMFWVNVGYENETQEYVGISHMLEHLYYRKKIEPDQHTLLFHMRQFGVQHNAVTAQDHTHFYAVSDKHDFKDVLTTQIQGLFSNNFDNEDLHLEKAIIFEELKKKISNPQIQAREALLSMMYPQDEGLKQRSLQDKTLDLTLDAVKAFHRRHYTPKNVTLCIYGAVDVAQTIDNINAVFAGMTALESYEFGNSSLQSKSQTGSQSYSRVLSDHAQAYIKIGFKLPVQLKTVLCAELLSIILGKGKSSVLANHTNISAGTSVLRFKEKSLFLLEAECEKNDIAHTEDTLLKSLYALSEDFKKQSIWAQQALEKAKKVVYSSYFSQDLTLVGAAYKQCYMQHCLQSFSAKNRDDIYLKTLNQISIMDCAELIATYFALENIHLLEWVPKDLGYTWKAKDKMASLFKRIEPYCLPEENRHNDPIDSDIFEPLSQPYSVQKEDQFIRQHQFNNGTHLTYFQKPHAHMSSMSIRFKGGRLEETYETSGYTDITLKTTALASMRQTQLELQDLIESKGIQLVHDTSADHFGYMLTFPNDALNDVLLIVSSVLQEPYINRELLQKQKFNTLQHVAGLEHNLFNKPIELFYQALMGMHPYAWPRHGHFESIENIDEQKMMSWHKDQFCLSNMVISYVGACPYAQVHEATLEHFDFNHRSIDGQEKKGLLSFMPPRSPVEKILTTQGSQVGFAFGFKGLKHNNKDKIILDVIQNILSGLGGRLFNELRDRRALVYQSNAYNINLLNAGAFFVYAKTNLKNEEEVKNRILVEYERLKSSLVSQEELEIAKHCALNQYHMNIQASNSLAYLMAQTVFNHAHVDELWTYEQHLKKINVANVLECANTIFDLNQSALGILRGENDYP